MRKVTLFTRAGCHLCEVARESIDRVRSRTALDLEIIDIDDPANERWLDEYDIHVPVVHLDGKEFARYRLDEQSFRAVL